MTAAAKRFSALAVAGVYTGCVLEERGFGDIHAVMGHLFPGIMTLGVAAMAETASAEIARQFPELVELGKIQGDDWSGYAARVVEALGPTLDVVGPLDISEAEIAAAFDRMGRRIS